MNENYETRLFELVYNIIANAFSQVPALGKAYSDLPLWAQEIAISVIMICSIGIIVSIVLLSLKIGKWWLERH